MPGIFVFFFSRFMSSMMFLCNMGNTTSHCLYRCVGHGNQFLGAIFEQNVAPPVNLHDHVIRVCSSYFSKFESPRLRRLKRYQRAFIYQALAEDYLIPTFTCFRYRTKDVFFGWEHFCWIILFYFLIWNQANATKYRRINKLLLVFN